MLSSELAKNNVSCLSSLQREIQCLSKLLSILSPRLGSAKPHPRNGRGVKTVDDLLVHIAILLSTGLEQNLVVALSGSPADVFNLTLTVITEGNIDFKGMVTSLMPMLITF